MRITESVHKLLNTLLYERDLILGERKLDTLRRWNVRSLDRSFSEKLPGEIRPIPEVGLNDIDKIFSDYISNNRPVVIKGAASDWDATKTWTFEYFKQAYGDDNVLIANENFERTKKGIYYDIKLMPCTISNFVDAVDAGKNLYLKFLPTFKQHPELLEHMDLSTMAKWCKNNGKKYEATNEFYMGGKNSITHLHCERSNIFHACMVGKKRWRIYSPENFIYLYPVPARTLFIASEVNFMEPDYDIHPWFRYANGYETILDKGDILYLPAYYWHAVENLTSAISANYLWYVPSHAIKALPLMWINGELLRTRGAGTIEQFVKFFSGRILPSIHG